MNPTTLTSGTEEQISESERRSICDEWIDRVSEYRESIMNVLHGSETEFLEAGSKLQGYLGRNREIARMASEASELTGDARMGRTSAELKEELERLAGHLNRVALRTGESLSGLASVTSRVRHMEECHAGFKRVVRTLRVLAISTRIESARLIHHEAGFNTLADDVEKLARLIETKFSNILEKSRDLASLVSSTHTRLSRIAEEQQASLQQVLSESRQGMEAILDINRRSGEVSASVTMILEEVTEQIHGVVTSLQFHDITRQQLEHVAEAFEDIRSNLDGVWQNEETFVETAGLVGDMGDLESGQLENSARELREAVDGLLRDLRLVGQAVQSAADEIGGIIRASGKGSESLLARVQGQIDTVARLIHESAARDREMASAMDSVAATVSDMELFVGDIEEIGAEIELIALNARIKAAHTGESGAALGVLAEAIQKLSADARGETIIVAEALKTVASEARDLFAHAEDVAREGESAEENAGTLQAITTKLRTLEEGFSPLVSAMASKAGDLSGEIHEVAERFHHHETVSRVVDEVRGGLAQIISLSREIIPIDQIPGRAARLEKLMARYTMQSERMVHRTALGGSREEAGRESGGGSDLGDNVELF